MGIIGGILDTSKRSLNAQSLVIRTISDNISNVNTPGYSRRTAELITTQGSGIGNLITGTGVEVNRVTRAVDEFLNREQRGRIADRAGAEIRQQYLERAEQPFELKDTPGHIAYELNNFFASLQDLKNIPSDLALRTQVMQAGQSLTASIRDTFNHLARLQREADTRIAEDVNQVNTLTAQIAAINGQIVSGELATQQNLTLRDSRDELLRKLSELIPVTTLEDASGQILVSLSSGFALVQGSSSNQLSFDASPSFGADPVGLDGAGLGNVIFSFGASDVDFNRLLASGSGEIGALLRLRGTFADTDTSPWQGTGELIEVASQVEMIARDLLIRFNANYSGPEGNTAVAGYNPSAVGLDGTQPGAYGLFNATGLTDANADNIPNDFAATGLYGRSIDFTVTNPLSLAIATDVDPAAPLSYTPGDASGIDRLLTARNASINYTTVTYPLPSVVITGTIDQLYQTAVGTLGSSAAQSKSDFEAFRAREDQVNELHASLAGVSLDEEFAQLINFQRAFQGAARMVKVGDEMFSEVINLLN